MDVKEEMDEAEDLECCQHCQDNILAWLAAHGYVIVYSE